MSLDFESYNVKIFGHVTGVGFRYFTYNFVKQFSEIKGFVRNIGEGEVEVIVQGKKEHVAAILEWLKKGPAYARIDKILINRIPLSKNLISFRIE